MKLKTIVNGALEENCYLVVEETSGQALVVDPGTPSPEFVSALRDMGMKELKYILLTHGHYDHILGVAFLKEQFPDAKIIISEPDAVYLTDAKYSGANPSEQTPVPADQTVGEGDRIPFAGKEITVIATPGHTKGSLCFLLDQVMFSGDTLFFKTYGRTDFYSGNLDDMRASLYKLGSLEGDYKVFPGHGPSTSLDFERTHNRMMRRMTW